MKKLVFASVALSAMILLSGCNPFSKMQKNINNIDVKSNPEVLVLKGQNVTTDMTVTFPAKYFSGDAVLKLTPVLVYEGGEIAGTPKIVQGQDVKDNYAVINKKEGGSYSQTIEIPYNKKASLSTLELRIEGKSTKKDGDFAPMGTLPVAQGISSVQALASFPYMTVLADNFKRVTTVTNEAGIKYAINSAQGKPLTKAQVKTFQDFIKKHNADANATLGNVQSKGYASPDGPEKFNEKLSADRSKNGEKSIKGSLNNRKLSYDAAAYGEDWDGFKKLVEESDIQDKDLILQLLQMYDSSSKRDEEIHNLSFLFEELKKSILPQLRRTQIIISADIMGKSDEEIIAAAEKRDATLNVEEMLYAAKLVNTTDDKIAMYQLAADTYNDARAWNNLAIEYVKAGDADKAKTAIDKAASVASCADINNNVAAVAIAQGDLETAKNLLANIDTKDANGNKALILLNEGNYAEAAKGLDGYNLAVAETLNGNYAQAKTALGNCECAYSDYLKAIISMREGDSKGALSSLKDAVSKDASLKAKAQKDIEFAKLYNTDEFRAL